MGKGRSFLAADRLNLLIALCAILISLASFYATYMQASAAEKQVKAMTFPLMGFTHSNYDEAAKKPAIAFTIKNSGSGPAIIHSAKLIYDGKPYNEVGNFMVACCNAEYKAYQSLFDKFNSTTISIEEGATLTSVINNIVLPAQQDRVFFKLYDHQNSHDLWLKVNNERWKLDVEFCYCTLLDDCFTSKGGGIANPVKSCKA
ncbi:hypothetical protein [Paraferrimonas sp. SM1919]|uniref:hypothetical protein n=1 Tax=Paraferrimonas sp. SM1919 TaxID=2662263 RepID=UPI0013D429E3|nr:hypothetical protein [Paraferrimonas sp. SM1919]